MTTVAVDIRANHDTGVARYGRSVLAAAAPVAAEQGIRLLAVVRPGQEGGAETVAATGHEVIAVPGDGGFVRDNRQLRELLTARRIDLYYTSHYTVDRQCPVPFTFTIHDLTRWRFPELSYTDVSFADRFGAAELERMKVALAELADFDTGDIEASMFTRYFTALNRDLAARARRIVTVSDATAGDIIALLGIPESGIDLIPCAVDTRLFRPRSAIEVQAVCEKYRLIGGPYLIFVGLAHPSKRFEWLVAQLAQARATFPAGARLAAVGDHADQIPRVRELLHELAATDFVTFTGRVSDDELAALYTGASAWVTASVNEGNNLPPLEALSCGSEVIATDIPPLRETLDNAAHFYPPTDGPAFVQVANCALSGTLPHRADDFTPPDWQSSGRLLVASWQRTLSSVH